MPDTNSIRKRLHQYLETADDKKVKALYAIMEKDIEASAIDWPDEIKAEWQDRQERYILGESPAVTAEESQERIRKIMGSGKK